MRSIENLKKLIISFALATVAATLSGCGSGNSSVEAASAKCASVNDYRDYVEVVDNCGTAGKNYESAMTGYVANNLCKNILRLKEDSYFLYRYLNFPKEFEGQVVTRNQIYLSDNWFDDAIQFGSFSDSKTIEWLKSAQLEVDNINTAIDASDNKKVNTLVNNLQKLVAQIDAGDLPEISPNC